VPNGSAVIFSREPNLSLEQWYTLYTKPNAEYGVATALQKRGVQTYLPVIESFKLSKERVSKPFFPCYLFAKIDFEIIGLSQVQWMPGLRRIVTFDNQLVPLADEVIELIQGKLGEIEASMGRSAHNFKPGETVRIITGPFQDMLAIFEGPTTPSMRVRVLLSILGQASRMQVSVADIEKAAASAEALAPKRPRRTRGQGRYISRIF
jgi:transcription elongation factor/antiterminator RfaH